jgi:hypothetical protein
MNMLNLHTCSQKVLYASTNLEVLVTTRTSQKCSYSIAFASLPEPFVIWKVFLEDQHQHFFQLSNLWKMCLFYRSICLNCKKLGSNFIDCHIKKDCRKQLFEFEPENAYFKYCIKCSKEDDTQHQIQHPISRLLHMMFFFTFFILFFLPYQNMMKIKIFSW